MSKRILGELETVYLRLGKIEVEGVAVSLNSGYILNKSSSGDEIPERDVTYYLLCLLIYH